MPTPWLNITRGEAPLLVAIPHAGLEIPTKIEARLLSPALGRKDTDWWIDQLYDFAGGLGATTVRTAMSRTVIDVNRDPSGASLYPGQATTDLCPLTTFDGEPLYKDGFAPTANEILHRRATWFDPYHAALAAEAARLQSRHGRIVLYDAHAIRSRAPLLFAGELPIFNIGVNDAKACAPELTKAVEDICDASPFSRVTDGRFKGGWTTRRYGRPQDGVHAIQMELACRSYMHDPSLNGECAAAPAPFSASQAAPLRAVLVSVLEACLAFAKS
jgi:formiminoglutamase